MLIRLTRSLWLGMLIAAWGSGTLCAEGVKGRPIEYSEPPAERGKEPASRLSPGQSRLGQLENELNRPFEGLTPGNSLEGMMIQAPLPIPPPAVQSPKARELSKKQDWMFRSTEELLGIRTLEDKYKAPVLTPDGRDITSLRPMERAYLEAFDTSRNPNGTNQMVQSVEQIYGAGGRGALSSAFEPASPYANQFNLPGSGLGDNLGWNTGLERSSQTDAADFFKFNKGYAAPAKPTAAELQRVEEFKRILNFSDSPADATASGGGSSYLSPYVDSSFFDLPKPPGTAPAANLGGTLSGGSLGGTASPSWAPAAVLPPVQPTRSIAPSTSPFMTLPRRSF